MALQKSPFKFLDSYSKEDKNIFFGREHETEELYQKIFESKILLVYGITGTGKTSLINCGLANKFNESDWLPIYVRRNQNIQDSVVNELSKFSYDNKKANTDKKSILKLLRSVYLDNFKPIYLVFDQFEEIFIFGNPDERKKFIDLVDAINQSEIQCKMLFILREEFLANITEFERTIPEFFQNRIRIEKMSPAKALHTITGPCHAVGIEVQEKVAESILQKVSKDKSNVELTYLQVLLDKIYQFASEGKKSDISITQEIVNKVGDVEDILGDFLEQQIKTFENSEDVLNILKAFVSVHGTKKQVSAEEVNEHLKTFGQEVEIEQLPGILQQLVSKRILKEKDEQGHYELIHDALAAKIYEKITLLEKELIEIRDFLKNAYYNYEKRKVLLSKHDLSYIAPYRDKLFLSQKETQLIEKSERELTKQKRRRRTLFGVFGSIFIIILIGFSVWALNERNRAEKAQIEAELSKKIAEEEREKALEYAKLAQIQKDSAIIAREEAIHAKEIVTNELYEAIKNSLAISLDRMNILYTGIYNPVTISASGITPENLIVKIDRGLVKHLKGNKYKIKPDGSVVTSDSIINDVFLRVEGITKYGDLIKFKKQKFRTRSEWSLKKLPEAYFAGKTGDGGEISKNVVLAQIGIFLGTDTDMDLGYQIVSFSIRYKKNDSIKEVSTTGYRLSEEQKQHIKELNSGDEFLFNNIIISSYTNDSILLEPIKFKIK